MRNASAVWACIRYDLRKLLGSQRFYLAVLLVLFVIRDYLLPCKEWFVALSCNITPWIFPHVTDDLFIQMTIMCGLIFVLNDAPFLDDMQLFIIVRSGRCLLYTSLFASSSSRTYNARYSRIMRAVSR